MCRISSSKLKESNVRIQIFQWKSISFLDMINSKRAISHLLTKNRIMVPTFITCHLCDLLANTSSPYFYLMKKKNSIMTLIIDSRKIKRQEWGMGRTSKIKWTIGTYSSIIELFSNVLICYNCRWKSKNDDMNGCLCKPHNFPFWKAFGGKKR